MRQPDKGGRCKALKKILKTIFYTIMFLLVAGCLGILACALNPSLTQMLAKAVEAITGRAVPGADEEIPSGDGTSVRPGVNSGWLGGAADAGYEIPATRPSGVPSAVAGKTGYEPVREDAEQIPKQEAESLPESIGQGDTGNGLSFDRTFYPYFAMLESDMRQLYCQIYANALNLTASFTPVVPASVQQVKTVFEAVYNDHPELFWVETGYSCKYLRNGSCVEITLQYNDTVNYLDTAKQAFEAAAEQILTEAEQLGGAEGRERYVHDMLMRSVEYDAGAPMNQSAYSALVGGKSVCAGYARAFQYLMQQLGIPCYYCTGYAGQDHAWNIVKFDDTYHNTDVTWDDTDTPTYDYFKKTDAEFGSTHMRTGLSVYLPACKAGDSGSAGASGADSIIADLSEFINPNPVEPLKWDKIQPGDPLAAEEEKKRENLAKAGITESDVLDTLQKYYEDCLKQLKAAGKGDKHFSNVVPATLWGAVERCYGTGDFKKGYMEEALKALGVENVSIQLQVDDLSGGYYRIYHNLYIW